MPAQAPKTPLRSMLLSPFKVIGEGCAYLYEAQQRALFSPVDDFSPVRSSAARLTSPVRLASPLAEDMTSDDDHHLSPRRRSSRARSLGVRSPVRTPVRRSTRIKTEAAGRSLRSKKHRAGFYSETALSKRAWSGASGQREDPIFVD